MSKIPTYPLLDPADADILYIERPASPKNQGGHTTAVKLREYMEQLNNTLTHNNIWIGNSTNERTELVTTSIGRSLLGAVSAAAGRTALAAAAAALTITAGTGLAGGGNLTANRTISLDSASINSLNLADTAIQSGDNVSTLTNDAGYVDAAGAAAAAPVQTVAGRTGTVTIAAADITNSTAAGRALLTAADAAAQRSALGLGSAALASTGDFDAAGAAAAAQDFAIQRANHTGTQTAATINIAEKSVLIGDGSNLGSALTTGAKGRDLLAIADDAALQSEIVARIEGTTIAPAVVNAPITQNGALFEGPGASLLTYNLAADSARWYRLGTYAPSFTNQILIRIHAHTFNATQASTITVVLNGAAGTVARAWETGAVNRAVSDIRLVGNDIYISAVAFHRLTIEVVRRTRFTAAMEVVSEPGSSSDSITIENFATPNLAIGATALSGSERLRVAGGSVPGTPSATDCLFGGGVGRFGSYIDAPSLRYGGTDILARANTWTTAQTISQTSSTQMMILNNTSASGFAGGDLQQQGASRFRYVWNSDEDSYRIDARNDDSSFRDNTFSIPRAIAGTAYLRRSLAIGAISLAASERLRVAGGSVPGTPSSTDCLFGGGVSAVGAHYKVGANQVVGARGAAVADATDAASVITQLNALLARCRAHGLIAS